MAKKVATEFAASARRRLDTTATIWIQQQQQQTVNCFVNFGFQQPVDHHHQQSSIAIMDPNTNVEDDKNVKEKMKEELDTVALAYITKLRVIAEQLLAKSTMSTSTSSMTTTTTSATTTTTISIDEEELKKFFTKREYNQELMQKKFIQWKEEWRLVAQWIERFMAQALAALQAIDSIVVDDHEENNSTTKTATVVHHDHDHQLLFDMIMDYLRSISLCIGPKRMNQYWPTEVQWLTKIVKWLEFYIGNNDDDDAKLNTSLSDPLKWSSMYVLILWLASAVRTPFDLAKFDSSISTTTTTTKLSLSSRIDKAIHRLITRYPLLPVMSLLTGAYYSRPDIIRSNMLANLINDNLIASLINTNEDKSITERICILRSLASLLKSIERTTMRSYVDTIVDAIHPLVSAATATTTTTSTTASKTFAINDTKHELIIKLAVKILGRSALVCAKPRMFKWRYSCGKRVLDTKDAFSGGGNVTGDNHQQQKQSNDNDHQMTPVLKVIDSGAGSGGDIKDNVDDEEDDDDDDELDYDLPVYFEALIQSLISNITHHSTGVRYSVAKYLASICARLPYKFSHELLHYVCEQICATTAADDVAWHGACLTLAEFVRRGYVQASFMPVIINVVRRALFYEIVKGSFSLGTYVRDAACYICWAMARAYDRSTIGDHVATLAPLLLCVACFDRQLNCRRAASAVVQELAGRTQLFPHWIDVISRTEFHELSTLSHTYKVIGVHFAVEYDKFRDTMLEHLGAQKCFHSDVTIRRLAAETLGLIIGKLSSSPLSSSTLSLLQSLLVSLYNKTLDDIDINGRHGAMLALAFLIGARPTLITNTTDNTETTTTTSTLTANKICSLIEEYDRKAYFTTFGGELMREAALVLIEKMLNHYRFLSIQTIPFVWIQFVLKTLHSGHQSNETVAKHTVVVVIKLLRCLRHDQKQDGHHHHHHYQLDNNQSISNIYQWFHQQLLATLPPCSSRQQPDFSTNYAITTLCNVLLQLNSSDNDDDNGQKDNNILMDTVVNFQIDTTKEEKKKKKEEEEEKKKSKSKLKSYKNLSTYVIAWFRSLAHFIDVVFKSELRRSETLADAIRALIHIATYHWNSLYTFNDRQFNENDAKGYCDQHHQAFDLLCRCLSDHTISKAKGDIGLHVRIGALQSMTELLIRRLGEHIKCLRLLFILVIVEATFRRNKSFLLSYRKLILLGYLLCGDEDNFYGYRVRELEDGGDLEDGDLDDVYHSTYMIRESQLSLWSDFTEYMTMFIRKTKQTSATLYSTTVSSVTCSSSPSFNQIVVDNIDSAGVEEFDEPILLSLYTNLFTFLHLREISEQLWDGFVCVIADPILHPYGRALLHYLRSSDNMSPGERNRLLEKDFIRFFRKNAKDSRLVVPCLIASRELLCSVPTTGVFHHAIAKTVWKAAQNSLNPQKYLLAIDVLCALIPLTPSRQEDTMDGGGGGVPVPSSSSSTSSNLQNAFRYLFVLLGHRIPRVRSYAATQLFTALLALDTEDSVDCGIVADDDPDTIQHKIMQTSVILQETDWLVEDEAKVARDRVRELIKSMQI